MLDLYWKIGDYTRRRLNMKRFSEMSPQELSEEINRLAAAVHECTVESERDVLYQKWMLARSYAVREQSFPPGQYRVEGKKEQFTLHYLNGVMGWGVWEHGEEGAVPLAALQANPNIHILRIRTEQELHQAFQIRVEVFVEEQQVPKDVELDEYDVSPQAARHILVMIDGQAAATGRWIKYKPDTAKMQRIAVRQLFRGLGLGRKLMEALEEWAREEGFAYSLLDAQCQAEPFYAKLGYVTVSSETFLDAGIPHVRMKKKL
jgi:predicted GNAT family N-acyltransferase